MTDVTQNQDTAAQQQAAQQPATDGANSGSSNGALFTQEQVNKGTGQAREEGRKAAIADLLKKSGRASLEELLADAEEAKALKQSQMTEADKVKTELERERKAREAAEQRIAAIEAERRNDRIATYLQAEASKMKASDTETVLIYAREKHRDALNEIMAEDGTPNEAKAKALLEKIKTEKALYFTPVSSAFGSQSNAGGRTIPSEAEALKRASAVNQRLIRGG